jgi:predicted RNA methylase
MLKNLKKLWRGSRRARLRYAQLAELRAAVAALAQGQAAALGKPIQGVEIDGMLLHAAKARVDMERIEALYGSVAARLAAVERRLDRLAAYMANPPTHSR